MRKGQTDERPATGPAEAYVLWPMVERVRLHRRELPGAFPVEDSEAWWRVMSADPVNAEKKYRLSYLTVAQMFRLDIACQQIKRAFGGYPYLVGSVLTRPDFRDVDLRLLMCERRGSTDLVLEGRRLRFLNAAISEWIATSTGLPIDFQFQDEAEWDEYDRQTRHPRGLIGDE